jgi:signal transduction histidine kinase
VNRRLVTSYLVLTLVILLVLEVPLAVGYADRATQQLTAELQTDAFAIADFAEDTLEGNDAQDLQVLAREYATRTDARIVIVDAEGVAVADSEGPGSGEDFTNRPEIAEALAGSVASGTRRSETLGSDLLYVAVPVASGEIYGAVRISYDTAEVQEQVRRYWATLVGIAVVSLVAAALVGSAFARWVARPVERIQRVADELGRGDLSVRARSDDGPPEVRALARSFNQMATRLEELVGAQEQFVADASHQLRTPLTALRLRIENAAEECAAGSTETTVDLEAALTETDRLARLVDGLLALARADRAVAVAEPLDAARILRDRAAAWSPLADEHGVTLTVDASPGLVFRAAEDRVSQVVDNLLANAVDASRAGDRIELTARQTGSDLELHVVDHGSGLSDDDRVRAFDRLWRIQGSPTSGELGGTGLGLAIVRKLVAADGGTAELLESLGGGVDAVVRYPTGSE